MVKYQTGVPRVAHPALPLPLPPAPPVAAVEATAATPKSTIRLAFAIVVAPPHPRPALAAPVQVLAQAAASPRSKIQSRYN